MTKFAPLITYNGSCLPGKHGFMKGYGGLSLYIELYLDVLFFINLCMNYLLLRSVQVLTGKSTGRIRCILGSALGAFGVCAFVCLPVRISFANLLPVHVVTSTLMVKIGCKIKDARNLVKGVTALYFAGFLWGGMFLALYQDRDAIHLRTFLFLSIIFYELLVIGIDIYRCNRKHRDRYCDVTLYVGEKSKKVRGLYDTGNHLSDQWSGLPVSVADEAVIQKMLDRPCGEIEELRPHYIPYRAIGTSQGVLLAVTIDAMDIDMNERTYHISKPVLALAKESVSFTQHYQLILNPNLIDS